MSGKEEGKEVFTPEYKQFLMDITKNIFINADIITNLTEFDNDMFKAYKEIQRNRKKFEKQKKIIETLQADVNKKNIEMVNKETEIVKVKNELTDHQKITQNIFSNIESSIKTITLPRIEEIKQEIINIFKKFKQEQGLGDMSNQDLQKYLLNCTDTTVDSEIKQKLKYVLKENDESLGIDNNQKIYNLLTLSTDGLIYKNLFDKMKKKFVELTKHLYTASEITLEYSNQIPIEDNIDLLKTKYYEFEKEYVENHEEKIRILKEEQISIQKEINRINYKIQQESIKNFTLSDKDEKTLKYFTELQKKLEIEATEFRNQFEEGKKALIMFKSFRYNDEEDFIKKNEIKNDLLDKLEEKYVRFKIFEDTDFKDNNTPKIKSLKGLIEQCTDIINNSRNKTSEKLVQGKFINFYNNVNKVILEAFPVKSIINFSTNVKPPDEGGSSRETYTYGIDYEKNTDQVLKKKFTKKQGNMLDKHNQTPKTDNNEEGILQKELGEGLAMIKSKDKYNRKGRKDSNGSHILYGPFYKIFHTSNTGQEKKQYIVDEDLNRFFDEKDDIQHITYAGYGFSGSGKTYTLIEGENESYYSIINQISTYITGKKNSKEITDININIYEKYKEIKDKKCNYSVGDVYNFTKEKSVIKSKEEKKLEKENYEKLETINELQKDVKLDNLAGTIKEINKTREKNQVLGNKDLYRTSIRRTTYNPESSRAHLFVDITFKVDGKNKKITVMDMAGSEDVDVIQNDYFESINKYKVESTKKFEKRIDDIIYKFTSCKDFSSANTSLKNIQENFNGIKSNFLTTGGQDNYIIPIRWTELFFGNETSTDHSIASAQEWKENDVNWTNHKNFIKEYNNSQFTAKFKLLIDFNDVLKKIEEPGKEPIEVPKITNPMGQKLESKAPTQTFKSIQNDIEELFKSNDIPLPTKGVVKNFNKLENIFLTGKKRFYARTINKQENNDKLKNDTFQAFFSENENSVTKRYPKFITTIKYIIKKLNDMFKKDGTEQINIYYQKTHIESKIKTSITKKFLKTMTFDEFKEIVETAVENKEKWNKEMITKYHCPVRFQGKAIKKSIVDFKNNLKQLNEQKKNFSPGVEKFPYNVTDWVGTDLNKKNFIVFTNIRLDFTDELCNSNPQYKPVCDAYDNSLKFSHDLLYSEQQNVDPDYKKKVEAIFEKNVSIKTKPTKDEAAAKIQAMIRGKQERDKQKPTKKIRSSTEIKQSEQKLTKQERQQKNRETKKGTEVLKISGTTYTQLFGKKKVSKKTSTRSFRKRGRRRAPSGTEIL